MPAPITRTPSITIASLPPTGPQEGDLWWSTITGLQTIWYDDGNTAQWVVTNPGNGGSTEPGPPGPPGSQGPPGTGAASVTSLAGLKNLSPPLDTNTFILMRDRQSQNDRGGGLFTYRFGNQAANVAADPLGGIWVAPNSSPLGEDGAWQRVYDDALWTPWWGIRTTSPDNAPGWHAINSYVKTLGTGRYGTATIRVPGGDYVQTPVTIDAQGIVIDGDGIFAPRFVAKTNTQSHVFHFARQADGQSGYVEMRNFQILGHLETDEAKFALAGIISDVATPYFHNFSIQRCADPLWIRRGNNAKADTFTIGTLANDGHGIRLGGIDVAANPLASQQADDIAVATAVWGPEYGGILTFTTASPHIFTNGDTIIIHSANNPAYNTTLLALSETEGSSIRARMSVDPGAYTGGGTITVATYVAQLPTRLRRFRAFNIYGSEPAGYNGKFPSLRASLSDLFVLKCCLPANPGTSTKLGTSSITRGWGAAISETRIGPRGSVYAGASSVTLQEVTAQSWSPDNGGTVTYTTPEAHNINPGDRFTVRYSQPGGFNGTITATASDGRTVSGPKVVDPNTVPNSITAASWAAVDDPELPGITGIVTYTTLLAHGLVGSVRRGDEMRGGSVCSVIECEPDGYNIYNSMCLPGTEANIIKLSSDEDPGAFVPGTGQLTALGQLYDRYNGTGVLCDTDNGATVIENIETGSCNFGFRIKDTLGLGDADGYNYRGTGFLKLRGITTGNCGVRGISIEDNGSSFKMFTSSISAPGDTDADGVYVDSLLAAPQINGCEWHNVRRYGVNAGKCKSITMQNNIFSDIGSRGNTGPPGIACYVRDGSGDIFFLQNTVYATLQNNTSARMDHAVYIAADGANAPDEKFTGRVFVAGNTVLDMNLSDYENDSSEGQLITEVDETFVTVPESATPQDVRDLATRYDTLWFINPLVEWSETLNLDGLNGKTLISSYTGNSYSGSGNRTPLIRSTADLCIQYNGKNMVFSGSWWIKSTKPVPDPNSICIRFGEGVFDTHWGNFMPDNWGICRVTTNNNVHGILTDAFYPINCWTYGFLAYSHDGSDSMQYIVDSWCDAQRCEDTFVCYSMGPGVGSTGSMGLHVAGGIVYGALHAFHSWPNNPFKSIVHSAGVTTFETTFPHGLRENMEFTASGTTPSAYNAVTATPWITLPGTTGTTLKVTTADFGPVTVLGAFLAQSFAGGTFGNMPRSMHFEEFQRRGGQGHSYNVEVGTNVSFTNVKSDGTTNLMNEIVSASWIETSPPGTGTFTFNTLKPHGIKPGEKFRTYGITTAGYNAAAGAEWVAVSNTAGTTLRATGLAPAANVAVLPTVGQPEYPAQTSFIWHGWMIGPNFTGTLNLRGCQGYDHHGAGFYSEATLAESINIEASQFSNNSSDVNPNFGPGATPPNALTPRNSYNLYDGLYFAPGTQRVNLTNVIGGTGEHYRRGNSLMTFVTQPGDTQTLLFNGQVIRFMTTPVQSFDIARGANMAAALANLIAFMNTSPYFNNVVARAEGASAYRLYRATGGNEQNLGVYTVASGTAGAAVTFSAATLAGGSVIGNQRYGLNGIADGVRNCTIDRTCNFKCNTTGEMSGAVFPGYVVDVYTVPGSWTFPGYQGVKNYEFLAWGAGAGGGSGRQGAAGTARAAGTGGSGTVPTRRLVKAAEVTLPINVTVGAGGAGGAAVATPDTNGNTATDGGDTWVGGTAGSKAGGYLFARGGQRGGGGTAAASNASNMSGTSTGQLPGIVQTNGRRFGLGVSITAPLSVTGAADDPMGGAPGGTGATLSAANVDLGAAQSSWGTWADPAGVEPVNVAAGVNGQDGTSSSLPDIGGNGGGGGGAGVASAAGRGGHGGVGSGGGSGGASLNGFASGAGGNGGPGKVTIYSNF